MKKHKKEAECKLNIQVFHFINLVHDISYAFIINWKGMTNYSIRKLILKVITKVLFQYSF